MELLLAKIDEYNNFYQIKKEHSNLFWTGWNNEPNYDKLKPFFLNVINNNKTKTDRKIYLVHDDGEIVGYIYIDYVDDETFHISPAISEKYQRKGYGKKAIDLAVKEGISLGFNKAEAYIREDNIASRRCFEKCSFIETNKFENKYIPNQNKEIKMIRYIYENK